MVQPSLSVFPLQVPPAPPCLTTGSSGSGAVTAAQGAACCPGALPLALHGPGCPSLPSAPTACPGRRRVCFIMLVKFADLIFIFFSFFLEYLSIYLAVLGLGCGTQDL